MAEEKLNAFDFCHREYLGGERVSKVKEFLSEEEKLEIWIMAGLLFVLATSHLHNVILNFIE